jgi:hypothetical protein
LRHTYASLAIAAGASLLPEALDRTRSALDAFPTVDTDERDEARGGRV